MSGSGRKKLNGEAHSNSVLQSIRNGHRTPSSISNHTKINKALTIYHLGALLKAGKIAQVAKGRYTLPEGEAVPRKKSPPSKMSLARVIRDMVDRAVKNRFEAWEEDFARRIGG